MINEFVQDVVHLTIFGAQAVITGDADWQAVYDACSYKVEGAEFSKAFKRGIWNGRTYLINKKTGSFPSGLVFLVKKVCEEAGKQVFIHDRRIDPGSMGLWQRGPLELNNLKMEGKYQYQKDSCEAAISATRGVLDLCTGSGKSNILAALTSYFQLPTLITVPSKELLYQLRKTLLEEIPNVTEESIGIIGDNEWQIGTLATVAIVDTLASRSSTPECRKLLDNTDVLISDEVHTCGSEEAYSILSSCNAYYRYGFSGTPLDRTDGANLRIYALFGDVITKVSYKQLVETKVLPKAKIIFDKIQKPVLTGKIKYPTAYKMGVVENKYFINRIVEWTKVCVDNGLSVLILVEHIAHGKAIDDALWNLPEMIPHTFINGNPSEKANREEGFSAFDKREIPVLVSSNILGTGVSSKSIDVLIRAGVQKSTIQTLQGLGRTLRGDKAIVIEFSNYCHKYLLEHSLKRLKDYKKEDCFDIVSSGPDATLIKRLWNGGNK